jgi:DNA adenine methylase
VNRAVLADPDPLVASFWQVAASEPQKLIARMREEHETWAERGGEVALRRWDYWKSWRPDAVNSSATNRFEMAVKCLFLNRTTFSGILHGRAGPIGGRTQTSAYDIGCRFNPDGLPNASSTSATCTRRTGSPTSGASIGRTRWTGSMDHQTLAGYLRTEARFRWLLSYDHDPELLSNSMLY